jgi:tubulin polyglutamylase TTLL6/13
MIAKTIISVQPHLQHSYRSAQPDDQENSMCFEVLGFDVIFDHKLRPFVLEVNALASFGTDSPLDKKIKLDLMRDTFTLLNLSTKKKKQLKKEKEEMFKRRAMGDKAPNKADREQNRRRNQALRDEFDMANLGGYRLVYPVKGDAAKARLFESFID